MGNDLKGCRRRTWLLAAGAREEVLGLMGGQRLFSTASQLGKRYFISSVPLPSSRSDRPCITQPRPNHMRHELVAIRVPASTGSLRFITRRHRVDRRSGFLATPRSRQFADSTNALYWQGNVT